MNRMNLRIGLRLLLLTAAFSVTAFALAIGSNGQAIASGSAQKTPTPLASSMPAALLEVIPHLISTGRISGPIGQLAVSIRSANVSVDNSGTINWDTLPGGGYIDFVVGAEMLNISDVPSGECGFVVRMQDTANYLKFSLSLNGDMHFGLQRDDRWLDTFQFHAAGANTGTSSASNTFVIAGIGGHFNIYLNGAYAGMVTIMELPGPGEIGYIAGTYGGTSTSCTFNNMWVWVPG